MLYADFKHALANTTRTTHLLLNSLYFFSFQLSHSHQSLHFDGCMMLTYVQCGLFPCNAVFDLPWAGPFVKGSSLNGVRQGFCVVL